MVNPYKIPTNLHTALLFPTLGDIRSQVKRTSRGFVNGDKDLGGIFGDMFCNSKNLSYKNQLIEKKYKSDLLKWFGFVIFTLCS